MWNHNIEVMIWDFLQPKAHVNNDNNNNNNNNNSSYLQ